MTVVLLPAGLAARSDLSVNCRINRLRVLGWRATFSLVGDLEVR
jgi:hypothetical protein